ncbi:MAG TPA: patatin-like phospholipase family protein [Paludibacter sp.]|nr:patatin-like phospholipase family protein [Paludibacter sp.]
MNLIKDIFSGAKSKPGIGLCLSGGGALGFAHIGVIKALEEQGIEPGFVAGSSMGAVIGAFYAAGYSSGDLLQLIKDDKLYKISKLMSFRPSFFKTGLSNHNVLSSLLHELIPHDSFDMLRRKLQICVVNLNKAEWQLVDSGNQLKKWVVASASIPGVFETVNEDGMYYVDGGLLNNMPAQGIAACCKNIIGVDVIPHVVPSKLSKVRDTLAYSVRAVEHQNSQEGRSLCDFIIEPKAIEEFHEFSFDAYQAICQYGYDAAIQCFEENPAILKLGNMPVE